MMEERISMLADYDTGAFSVAALSARYGVSRDTFYFWLARRQSGAGDWFAERSHAPLVCPHATAASVVEVVVALRRRFVHFGPKKIRAYLQRERPEGDWPASSTIGDILSRAGLIEPSRRRQRPLVQQEIAAPALAANAEWSVDFKGWFRTRDGMRCDPLTLSDTASRYLLETRIVAPTYAGVRTALERVFSTHGLPEAIRSDNGPPFGSTGAGGLSRLSVWWLRLGIEPHYIRPAAPQENGRHERMHRTLKAQTSRPPAADSAAQQARFDSFRQHYNEERPHEALAQTPPAVHWRPSARAMPCRLAEPWYDADHQVRRVRTTGEIKWHGQHIYIGEALVGELIGIAPTESGHHLVRFCHRDLGIIDPNLRFKRFAPPRARPQPKETNNE
jgi:transposase InsO family protein